MLANLKMLISMFSIFFSAITFFPIKLNRNCLNPFNLVYLEQRILKTIE